MTDDPNATPATKPGASKKKPTKKAKPGKKAEAPTAKYPRHSIDKTLRIPRAILDQNAGKECTVQESAKFLGVGFRGPYQVEVSSGIKYGLLTRPSEGRVAVTERAKQILRPQSPSDELQGLRDGVLGAPVIQDVYGHYLGENLPDDAFFTNALTDKFKIPPDKVAEFRSRQRNDIVAHPFVANGWAATLAAPPPSPTGPSRSFRRRCGSAFPPVSRE